MSKTIKILLCLCFIFLIFLHFNFVNATEEDLEVEEIIDESDEIITQNASDISNLSILSPSTGTSVTNINSYEQANISLNNILCIILISIGTLLILFAIAILIRLKN